MGPGPSDVHPRVLRAQTTPLLGHLDPAFLELMDEIQDLLRYVYRTDNEWTFAIPGTGSAAMEAALANCVAPDETVLVPTNGYFGGRMAEMVRRLGGTPVEVEAPWGQPLDPADVADAFETQEIDVFAFVHAETSTGTLQPDVPRLTEIAHEEGALVIADTVTSLGGVEFRMDEWDVDVAYSAGQKCLSAPPGMSPVTVSGRARERIEARESPSRSWYVDLSLLGEYWGEQRTYHHTAPISNTYALREALRMASEEGIEARWERHHHVAGALRDGLEAMGLSLVSESWLPALNAVYVPEGVEASAVTDRLLADHDIEVAGGLGDLAGDALRIGCMGYSARPENVLSLLAALGDVLEGVGGDIEADAALAAARTSL
jgi:alanine-glyoxylate transaminase/serine-glyoxylate transaminase/serine-pyruvate transaminase